jgi:hypothetical protein
MPFTSETAKKARLRKAGLHAARVNRRNGWECLVKARAMRSHKAAIRRRERVWALAQKAHLMLWMTRWGPPGAWLCLCGEYGVGESMAQLHSASVVA